MDIIIEQKTPVYLSPDEALLFVEFQRRYQTIASIIGNMEGMGLINLKNSSLTLDFDMNGVIQHSSITSHFRKK